MSIPTSETASGTMSATTIVTSIGKIILSVLLTGLSCSITIWRSLLGRQRLHYRRLDNRDQRHVRIRRDSDRRKQMRSERLGHVYSRRSVRAADYTDRRSLVNAEVYARTTAPRASAPRNVMNTPSCAAAPKRILLGLAISGPKSVIQPMPRNISGGYIPSLNAQIQHIQKSALREYHLHIKVSVYQIFRIRKELRMHHYRP